MADSCAHETLQTPISRAAKTAILRKRALKFPLALRRMPGVARGLQKIQAETGY
jgi:hypothetical protein